MCQNLHEGNEFDEDLDEALFNLFKKFKDINEKEAGEPLNIEDLKVDFIMVIQEKISKVVDDNIKVDENSWAIK